MKCLCKVIWAIPIVQGNLDKHIRALDHYGREGAAISALHSIPWAPPSLVCNAFPQCVDIVLDPKWRG